MLIYYRISFVFPIKKKVKKCGIKKWYASFIQRSQLKRDQDKRRNLGFCWFWQKRSYTRETISGIRITPLHIGWNSSCFFRINLEDDWINEGVNYLHRREGGFDRYLACYTKCRAVCFFIIISLLFWNSSPEFKFGSFQY